MIIIIIIKFLAQFLAFIKHTINGSSFPHLLPYPWRYETEKDNYLLRHTMSFA